MQNTAIVASPEVSGNIGSCTSEQITVIKERNGFFTIDRQDIVTNSCTGQVVSYDEYWVFTDIGGMTIALLIFGFIIVVGITLACLLDS